MELYSVYYHGVMYRLKWQYLLVNIFIFIFFFFFEWHVPAGDKSIISISRIHVYCEIPSESSLYVSPRTTLQQLENWAAFVATHSDSSIISTTAISALQSLLLSTASLSVSLRTCLVLLSLSDITASAPGASPTLAINQVPSHCLPALCESVEVEHKRLLGAKPTQQAFKYAFDPTCKHNSLTVSEDGMTVKSTDSEKAYILVNKGTIHTLV